LNFKTDENLPAEAALTLREAGFEADTVDDEHLSGADDSLIAAMVRSEGQVLITLDLDFANIRAYPPSEHTGIIVLRSKRQDTETIVVLLRRLIMALKVKSPVGQLWIVESDRIRFRAD
jgi:predicted nuclease of predicted toxin-antitoxin system